MWETSLLTIPEDASSLHLNATISGKVVVELLDSDTGAPLKGFAAADCDPWTGNRIDAVSTWNGHGLHDASGRAVRLRFHLRDREIFSFRFE